MRFYIPTVETRLLCCLYQHVFVILYLLLKRHHDIMRVAQRVLLHPQEISHAASTVVDVRDAFVYRVAELKGASLTDHAVSS